MRSGKGACQGVHLSVNNAKINAPAQATLDTSQVLQQELAECLFWYIRFKLSLGVAVNLVGREWLPWGGRPAAPPALPPLETRR